MRTVVPIGLVAIVVLTLGSASCSNDETVDTDDTDATTSGASGAPSSSGHGGASSSGASNGPPDGARPGEDGGVVVTYDCQREIHLSPAGDDGNDGSIAAPKRSIAKATRTAVAGDCLQLHTGTYAETDTIGFGADGTAAAPIVVRAADGPRTAIVDASARAGAAGPAVLLDVDHVVIDGLDFQRMPTDGGEQVIHIDGGKQSSTADGKGIGSVIRNCKITGGHDHIKINQWATQVTIEYNELYGAFGHIPFSVTSAKSLLVRGNFFHDWQSPDNGFIQVKGGSRDVVLDGNRFENVIGSAGAITLGDGCAGTCDFDPEHYACVNGRAINNVMVNVGRMTDAYGCKDCLIANNTGVGVATATVAFKLGLTTTGSTERATTNMRIVNNLVSNANGDLFGVIQINGAAGTGLRMDHNLYFNGAGSVTSGAPVGADANSIVGRDPLLASDASLGAGSPAIGAGLPLPGEVDHDFTGNARAPSNDIGAYQR